MVTKLEYNWFFTTDGDNAGDEFYVHEVGKKGVVKITEELPVEPGDKLCYVVKFDNGTKEIIYNPNRVYLNE